MVVDCFSVFNLVHGDRSRNAGASRFDDERQLLAVEGFEAGMGTYTYSGNPSFGRETDLTGVRTDQGTLPVGVTYGV